MVLTGRGGSCMTSGPPPFIVTRTPLRLSFAGGGTDLRAFYSMDHGAVVSTSLDSFVYVTVKQHGPVFDERIRVNYSATETVGTVDEIQNNIARECLRLLEVDAPIYISVVSDLPESSGLGGSSSFTVGLLHALHRYRGESPTASELGEQASRIEIEILREPIGKQDQYAAAFGGMNLLRFCQDDSVSVESLPVTPTTLARLFDHLVMFWTGSQRRASSVLGEQQERTGEHVPQLQAMRSHAYQVADLLRQETFDARAFGEVLDETWRLKRGLATAMTNMRIDSWYHAGRQAGALGGKLCGAGGGGFLLFVAPPERHDAIRSALPELRSVRVGYADQGSKVLLPADAS